jgi:hypothetical protein
VIVVDLMMSVTAAAKLMAIGGVGGIIGIAVGAGCVISITVCFAIYIYRGRRKRRHRARDNSSADASDVPLPVLDYAVSAAGDAGVLCLPHWLCASTDSRASASAPSESEYGKLALAPNGEFAGNDVGGAYSQPASAHVLNYSVLPTTVSSGGTQYRAIAAAPPPAVDAMTSARM